MQPDNRTPTPSTCSAISPSTRRSAPAASGPSACARRARTSSTRYGPEARQVLDDLLEKYAEHGTAQFVLPDVLKVPPVSEHGQRGEIIELFGGADELRERRDRTPEPPLCRVRPHDDDADEASSDDHRAVARQPAQVRARHHAEGQGAERRPRPAASAHLDHVPEVSRRPGSSAGAGSQARGQEVPSRPSSRPTAGETGRPTRRASPATSCSPSSTRTSAPARTAREGRASSPTCGVSTSANGDDRRDVIATVFQGVDNRMKSGYLLRDVINKVAGIHFTSSEEFHTLGALYESMLREMRDAAGDSGEFYTPRPVVRFMVDRHRPTPRRNAARPRLRHWRLLVEAFNHLSKQVKTVADRKILQKRLALRLRAEAACRIFSCQMNLLLHGLDAPDIDPGNALRFKISEIGEKDRVDVILTNPPFGGEEEKGIQGNFPDDRQTAETALLFLQLIMRKLRSFRAGFPAARAAVVVPNGTLFGGGVCARVKADLFTDFRLHTIVRLPAGVFAPYTSQETSLLFFERGGPTTEVWYYQHPVPPDRTGLKNPCYVKSRPLLFEEFAPLLNWWNRREENEFAWKVSASDLSAEGYNLDIRHPSQSGAPIVRSVFEVSSGINTAQEEVARASERLCHTLTEALERLPLGSRRLQTVDGLGIVMNPENRNPEARPEETFRYVDLSSVSFNSFDGVKTLSGIDAPSRARRVIREGDVILSTVRPYLCGHAVIPADLDDQICSTGFACFVVRRKSIPASSTTCSSRRRLYSSATNTCAERITRR